MKPSCKDLPPDRGAPASVIQLRPVTAARVKAPLALVVPPWAHAVDVASDRDSEVLRRRYGDRWSELPTHLGRLAAELERLLVEGPTKIDPDAALPGDAVAEASIAVRAAFVHAPMLEEEASVLGAALSVPLVDLPLRQLDEVVDALLALSTVAPGASGWANPADADAALLVLEAHGDDVRTGGELHRDVYERFTERVWDVRESRLRAGRRPLRLRSRWVLRSQLASASRSGSVPGGMRETSELLLRAHAARRRLAMLEPLLDRHLGRHHQGPRTDVSVALEALMAVRHLQRVLGDRLDVERLRGLLMADAFRTPDLLLPALNLGGALASWQASLEGVQAGDSSALPVSKIAAWAAETSAVMPACADAFGELEARGHPSLPLHDLVDALLLREHAAEIDSATSSLAEASSDNTGAS